MWACGEKRDAKATVDKFTDHGKLCDFYSDIWGETGVSTPDFSELTEVVLLRVGDEDFPFQRC